MVKGGTNFRKHASKRTKKRKGPARRPQEDVSEPAVTLVQSVMDDENVAGPSNVNIPEVISISEKKLSSTSENISHSINKEPSECPTGYRFIDMDILSGVFNVVACSECGSKVKLLETKKQGLSFQLKVICQQSSCGWSHVFWTSKKKKKSRNFDVNRRVHYAMRRIGNGYSGLKRFLMLMNHPHPMTKNNYGKITNSINKSVKDVAETIMQEACNEIRGESDVVVDTGVSNDGTWQKRGFTSYNGAVVSISILTGKILDVEAMSRFCQRCIYIETLKKTDPELYERSINDHDCNINHRGSAPKMEMTGVERIFGRSIDKNQLRYTEYYGDGDTKAFSSIESIYGDTKVIKQECIGHIQKRVGNRLRKLKKTEKGLGKLGLTDPIIDKLQNYYGMAVRSNVGDLAGMKKAIFAAWCHVCSSKECNYHVHCPVGPDSWCMYQTDIANGTSFYEHRKGLPQSVIKHVRAVFDDLSSDNLLTKCLHGKTQNQNESFNGTIWNRIPKIRFVQFKVFELAVFDAVAHFNIGNLATLLIFDKLGIDRGYYTIEGCLDDNKIRIENAKRKSMDCIKTRRRILRGQRKKKSLTTKQKEGSVYGGGKF